MVGDQHNELAAMRQYDPESGRSTVLFVRMNVTSTQAIPIGTSVVIHPPRV